MGIIATAFSTAGSYLSGHAGAQAAEYNAKMAAQNSNQSTMNANIVSEAGNQQTAEESFKARAAIGETLANQGAGNLDVNQGSPTDIRASEREIGMQDALTVRSNATKAAYGQQVQAVDEKAQSALDMYQAKTGEQAAVVGAANTFIGSVSDQASSFKKYQLMGGFSG